jgi:hypothetical protein
MGTFFAAGDLLGLPVWAVQRLWIGAILFAAGAGVLFLARSIRWQGPGVVVAALVYMLTPYTLQYAPRTSVLLLPFAALPWLVGLTERAVRTGGWRHPALIALVVMTCSGSNVVALAMVAPGPVLWIAFMLAARRTDWRRVGEVAWRTAVLTLGTCALWIGSLIVESRYGLNVLSYSETLQQVSTTSSAPEVLRGLGYWLFYGTEARQPNISGATHYLESAPILIVSYAVPGLALLAAFLTRWRYRAVAIAMVLTGVVVAIAAYPVQDPSVVGRGFKGLADLSSVALAFRSSTRAVPVVVLGLAMLLGAGVSALWCRTTPVALVATAVVVALVLANAAALFAGDYVDDNFSRPTAIPQYWRDAAAALDREGSDTRVLELPGSSFAAYRWGSTYQTSILATLLSRPSVAREQTTFGTPASADLLAALDRRIQEGVLEPAALAPIARLLSAGELLVRSDLEYERYDTARPRDLRRLLAPTPQGLDAPAGYGTPVENRPNPLLPLLDAQTLRLPANADDPPPVAIFRVEDAPAILRTVGTDRPTLLDGDGEGLVDAASVGLVTGDNIVLYAAWLASHPDRRAEALDAGADIVVTDTNRRRERRWRSTRDNAGLTDLAGNDQPNTGQGEATLQLFPGTNDDTRTVATPRGATVEATRYGNPITFETNVRAAQAVDGDPATAWEVGTITDPVGQHLTVRSDVPITADHVDLLQAQGGFRTRVLSEVTLRFDGGDPVRVPLDDPSLAPPGQRIEFTPRTFSKLDVEVTGTRETPDVIARGGSPSGIAELTIPGLEFDDLVRLPTDLTRVVGRDSNGHRLVYVLTRLRSDPAQRGDEETSLRRVITVPSQRTFSFTGTARLADTVPDDISDAVLGAAGASDGGVTATSSGRLPGAPRQRARAAFDGDPTTHWTGTYFQQVGSWVQADLASPVSFDRLDLAVVADGRHSVPTKVRIDAGGESRTVDLPPTTDTTMPDGVANVPVTFAPLHGSTVRVTVTGVREVTSTDAFSGLELPQPVAIAEAGIPGVVAAGPPAELAGACRTDLVTLDGAPVPVRIVGSTTAAVARDGLRLEACGAPLALDRGEHVLRSTPGRETGIDVDRTVLGSDRGGGALALTAAGDPIPPEPATGAPRLDVLESDATSSRVRVPASDTPFWLVLGESHSDGWQASVDGGDSLGEPTLVNGYANGWYVGPSDHAREIHITWAPQRVGTIALIIAMLAVLLCLGLVWRGRRWSVDTEAAPPIEESAGEQPALEIPGEPRSTTPHDRRVLVGLPLLATIVSGLVVGPLAGLATGALVAVAVVWSRGRVLLAVVSLTLVAAGMLGIVATQASENRPVGYAWTSGEEREHRLALTGLMLLAADPVVAAARRRRGRAPDAARGNHAVDHK